MKTEIKTVTPETAKELLKKNINNRPLSKSNVKFLSDQMKNDKWIMDGQPVRLDEHGRLIDGQHRLSAVVESGKTQKFVFISGINEDAFTVMDTGKKRTAGDALAIVGDENYNVAAGAIRHYAIISNKLGKSPDKSSNWRSGLTNTDIVDMYLDNPKIQGIVQKVSNKFYNAFNRVMTGSSMAGFWLLFDDKSVTDAEDFIHKLSYGNALEENSPILKLRNWLIKDKLSEKRSSSLVRNAIIIKAWNKYRKNQECKNLSFNQSKEKFPEIL